MASVHKQDLSLTQEEKQNLPDGCRVAIVVSRWNGDVTENLLKGAKSVLEQNGVKLIDVHYVPGAFELPMGASFVLGKPKKHDVVSYNMAQYVQYEIHGVICLGCVIQGETKHFDYVCQSASQGILKVGLKYNIPVMFGVLTDDNKEQSIARSGGELGNKGEESAVSCLQMIALKNKMLKQQHL